MNLLTVTSAALVAGMLTIGMPPGQPTNAAPPSTTVYSNTADGAATSNRSGGHQHVAFTRWGSHAFERGTFEHTRGKGGLTIGWRPTRVSYRDPYGSAGRVRYDRGRWFSPWVRQHFGL
ncbi:MAG: hypothetical protein H0V07_12505, partial [Propionibacteriales bacterium]|nr:hypothetical protein [Propionibacteriales bacterium]